ncbi:oxidoreductase [Streptomyces cinerochromogenes]|uniref:Oxidoreductase n=1 Tax=Streptomyces cinerochromogenes TaxID=66422 RepID=A0ABW7B9F9_9ACTN
MDKVWLVTGASSGFGREITEAAVAAGDLVIGAVRRPEALDDLVAAHPGRVEAVRLDVTDLAAVDAVVRDAVDRHGRIDVLVNNAGRTHVGAVEETTDAELRDLFDLHFFGPVALVRAVLPHMRERRSGAIVQMSSMGGQMSFAGFGAYSGTKFALEGVSEALADEVAEFGIKVLIVEPGAFRTSLFGAGRSGASPDSGLYAKVSETRAAVSGGDGTQPGDPAKAAALILAALDAERTPLRLPLGDDGVSAVLAHLDQVRGEVTEWEKQTRATAFDA